MRDRLRDLDHLHLASAELLNRRRRIDIHAQFGHDHPRSFPRRTIVHEKPEFSRLSSQKDVLGDGQTRDQAELLKYHPDPRRAGCSGTKAIHLPTEDGYRAFGRRQNSLKYLEQRRLSGAILTHQRVDRSLLDREVDPAEDVQPSERLLDADHLDRVAGFDHDP